MVCFGFHHIMMKHVEIIFFSLAVLMQDKNLGQQADYLDKQPWPWMWVWSWVRRMNSAITHLSLRWKVAGNSNQGVNTDRLQGRELEIIMTKLGGKRDRFKKITQLMHRFKMSGFCLKPGLCFIVWFQELPNCVNFVILQLHLTNTIALTLG